MSKKPQPKPVDALSAPSRDLAALPERVANMRESILEAAASGDVEALRPVIERNETMPIFGRGAERPRTFADAVEFLRRASFDGAGRETLRVLEAVLAQPYVKQTRGPATTYVWPAFALAPSEPADEDERLARYRCLRFAALSASGEDAPAVERVGIGADGTWHFFWAG
jgi:hypothetical protein